MICPNCQSVNADGTNFCIKCGTSLKAQQAAANQVTGQPMPQAPTQVPAQAPPPKKGSPLKVIALIVVALAVVIYAVYTIIMVTNPAYRLLLGLSRRGKTGAATVDSTITIKYKGENEALELLNGATFKVGMAVDYNKMLAEASFDILYDNKSIAKLKAGLAKEDAYIDPQDLYKKKFYYELDDRVLDIIEEIRVLIKYLREVDIKIDQKKYADIFKEAMGENIEGSLSSVTMTMDNEALFEFLVEFIEEAADDEKLIESLQTNIQGILDKILEDDHEFEILFDEGLIEDKVNDTLPNALAISPVESILFDMIDLIEDEDDFADRVQSLLEQAAEQLKDQQEALKQLKKINKSGEPKIKVTYHFDLLQNITGITYTMEMSPISYISNINGFSYIDMESPFSDDKYIVTVETKLRNGARFANFNRKGAIDILDVATDEDELKDIAEDILEKIIDNIEKNKKLVEDIEDKTGADVSDLEDMFLDGLF